MSIIKKPAVPPEIARIEIQIDQPSIEMLDRYAEFIGSDRNHVIVSAVRVIFKRDYEFKRWLRKQGGGEKRTTTSRDAAEGLTKQVRQ